MNTQYLLYRKEVPEDVRHMIREEILRRKVEGYDDFVDLTTFITAHVAAGIIPPEVASEARAYLELCLSAISTREKMEALKTGEPEDEKGKAAARRVMEAQQRAGLLPAKLDEDEPKQRARVVAKARWENEE